MSEHHATTVTSPKIKALAALSVIIAALLAFGLYYVRNNRAFVDATTHQPKQYTELYFTQPTSLPVNVPHGQNLPVSFTLHNVEMRRMAYAYTVSFRDTNGKVLAQAQQTLAIPSAVTKHITAALPVPTDYRGKAEVRVTLGQLKQSVHFWVRVV